MSELPGRTQPLLEIENLHVEYRTLDGIVKAVNGLNLRIDEGKALGLVGETGAGKTTTALAVMKLVPTPPGVITAGSVRIAGREILPLGDAEMQHLRGNQVSMIFQNPMASLNPVHDVGSQIAEVIRLHQGVSPREARVRAAGMLRAVGIPENRAGDFPHEFSGGMKQRVMIAIALACRPRLLIADEPTTALDVTIQAQVIDLIKSLKRDYSGAQLLITHDLGLVAEMCDDVAVMYAGRVVEKADIAELFQNPRHPYTLGLFGSLPNLKKSVHRLRSIGGLSPDPKMLPRGCPFHPRCAERMDVCTERTPSESVVGAGHTVCCWKYSESGGTR
ncbi:MAG: ABC transporter ATP-binding protein [Firmicutes bacterium]|jgi:peptide/nickel transport system ATP-binding protein|nr:ABC transporter ATP-binding protein [Bacillota bacterium]